MGVRLKLAGSVVVVAALGMHCTTGPFECQTDDQCNDGICSPEGWCAFEDEDCPSGWSYGAHAGGGLAGQCVPEVGTDGTSGADVTGDPSTSNPSATTVEPVTTAGPASTGSSTGDPGTDTDPPASCGDGVVDGTEDCDDANENDGDGCDADCTLSGETLWVEIVGEMGSLDAFRDVVVRGDGEIFVAGDFGQSPTVAQYDVDGMSYGAMEIPDSDSGHAWGIDTVDAAIVVGGRSSDETGFVTWISDDAADSFGTTEAVYDVALYETGIVRVWTVGSVDGAPAAALYDTTGSASLELGELEFPGPGTVWDVVEHEKNLYMVGTDFDQGKPWVQSRSVFGEQQWERLLEVGGSGSAFGVGVTSEGRIIVSGQVETDGGGFDGLLAVFETDGVLSWDAGLTPEGGEFANIHKAAGGPSGEIVAIGWVATGSTSADIWIGKYDSEGELTWERTFAGDGDGESNGFGIAVHEDGSITGVGAIANDDYDAWIVHLEP